MSWFGGPGGVSGGGFDPDNDVASLRQQLALEREGKEKLARVLASASGGNVLSDLQHQLNTEKAERARAATLLADGCTLPHERDAEIRKLKNDAATHTRMVDQAEGRMQMSQGAAEEMQALNRQLTETNADQAAELQEANKRITGLLQKYNALNQVYAETKALWESQTMRLHEETARTQLLTEKDSEQRDAVDAAVTRLEATHSADREALATKLRFAEERAAAAEASAREAKGLMDATMEAKSAAERRASEAEAMLAAKREMAAERIKKETDSAAAARSAAIARVERETTQMTQFKAEMEAEKIRLTQALDVARDKAERSEKLADEANARLRPLVEEIDELRRDVTSKETTVAAMEAAAEANLAERVELRSALAQYRAQAARGGTQTEELQRTLVTELEGARAAAERANAMSDQLHFERERTSRLELAVENAKSGELEAKRQARRMQDHMEAQTRLARNVTSAFNQLKYAIGSIDKQMERFAQYDMDGLAGVSDLNDVLDELDRQAPLPPLTNNEGGAGGAGGGGKKIVAAGREAIDGGGGGGGGGVIIAAAATTTMTATTTTGGDRVVGEEGDDKVESGGVDWVKLAAESRKKMSSLGNGVGGDPTLRSIASEY